MLFPNPPAPPPAPAPNTHPSDPTMTTITHKKRKLILVFGYIKFENFVSICLQVLERDKVMKRFQEVTAQLEQALNEIPLEKLDISDEVREQVKIST